jgi:murein DD-endopeptidase MepM/ murein hydrolase activator NlpD
MAAPKPATVTVAKGNTLSGIAAANNTTVAKIAAANPQITNVNVIKPGQVITLPVATATKITPAPATATSFVGPIPTGSTRTATGYTTSTGVAVNPTVPTTPFTSTEPVVDTPPPGVKIYTASDGTTFTDQNAFAIYAASLTSGAKDKYDAQQAAASKTAQDQADKRDAFALIESTMKSYGFTDTETSQLLAFAETQIMDPNVGPNQALLNMRNQSVYQARFSGNQTRLKAGLNALSEADYLAQENSLGEYFKAWGVSDLASRDQYATLIGNDVSATETNKRLSLAVSNVKNSDPNILKQLKYYYPNITDKDLVTYFLNPTATLPDLQKKVTTAEISSAALAQTGLSGDMTNAERLAALGVTKADALSGYQNVAAVLPTGSKLSDIYSQAGIKYTQATAEDEYLTQNADAAEKRKRLASMERAQFGGDSGVNPTMGNLASARNVIGKF